MQTKEGAVVHRTTLILFHMKKFWVLIPGEVISLNSLKYIQIHYNKHYNKSDFVTPEIHDAALMV